MYAVTVVKKRRLTFLERCSQGINISDRVDGVSIGFAFENAGYVEKAFQKFESKSKNLSVFIKELNLRVREVGRT